MTIMPDKWIKRMVKEKQMIKPFEKSQIRKKKDFLWRIILWL